VKVRTSFEVPFRSSGRLIDLERDVKAQTGEDWSKDHFPFQDNCPPDGGSGGIREGVPVDVVSNPWAGQSLPGSAGLVRDRDRKQGGQMRNDHPRQRKFRSLGSDMPRVGQGLAPSTGQP